MDNGKGLGHDIDVVDCTMTPNFPPPLTALSKPSEGQRYIHDAFLPPGYMGQLRVMVKEKAKLICPIRKGGF